MNIPSDEPLTITALNHTEQNIAISLHEIKNNNSYLLLNMLLSFEPTLFPKLQVYFADFPNLRYAINHQRLLTLRT